MVEDSDSNDVRDIRYKYSIQKKPAAYTSFSQSIITHVYLKKQSRKFLIVSVVPSAVISMYSGSDEFNQSYTLIRKTV